MTGLGDISHQQGRHDQAISCHQQALILHRETGDRGGEAEALNSAGEAFLAAGQPGEALTCHQSALTLARQTGDRYQQARAHQGLASATQSSGN